MRPGKFVIKKYGRRDVMEAVFKTKKHAAAVKQNKKSDVRIAIVEDDPLYREAIEHQLKKIPGNRLFSFGSGEECFRYYHLLDPEIMILDYRLNDAALPEKMDGLDVLREVKSVKPETEVIFLSGQQNFDVATAAIKEGASEYIVKDFNALTRLQNEVKRLSLFIRIEREKVSTRRWVLLCLGVIALLFIASFFPLPAIMTPFKIAFVCIGAGLLAFLLIARSRKKKRIHIAHTAAANEQRDEIWLD